MALNDILSVAGGRLHIGTSAAIGLTTIPSQNYVYFKALAVGTSGLFFGGSDMAVGLSAIGAGCELAANQVIEGRFRGQLYFASAGSTSTITYWIGKDNSPGATTL